MKSAFAARVMIVLVSIPLSSGCAAFRAGPSYVIEPWPLQSNERPLPSVSVVFDAVDQDGSRDIGTLFEQVRGATVRAFEDSGLFSHVSVGLRPSDFRAHVRFVRSQDDSRGSAFLLGLTVGVIPGIFSQTIGIRTELKKADGAICGKWERSERTTIWLGWLMLPFSPFVYPTSVVSDIVFDLNKSILIEASAVTAGAASG